MIAIRTPIRFTYGGKLHRLPPGPSSAVAT